MSEEPTPLTMFGLPLVTEHRGRVPMEAHESDDLAATLARETTDRAAWRANNARLAEIDPRLVPAPKSVYVSPPFRMTDAFVDAFRVSPEPPREPAFLGDLLVRPLPVGTDPPPSAEQGITANSIAVSFDVALDMLPLPGIAGPLTLEDHEARETAAQERDQQARDLWRRYELAREWITDPHEPEVQAVLALHAPVEPSSGWVECRGCDMAGYEAEPPEWPCSTVRAVADLHGIDLPDEPLWVHDRPTCGADTTDPTTGRLRWGHYTCTRPLGHRGDEDTYSGRDWHDDANQGAAWPVE